MADSTPLIEGRNLERFFQIARKRIEVLCGVNLKVQKGEKLFLCGASGAGKTTLLYTLAGLERPSGGEVMIRGQSLYGLPAHEQARTRNQLMGYVFQSYFLLPELTALENILVPAMIGRKSAEKRAHELLERVGLEKRAHHLPNELSGGEQQRVAIARSLINDPEILFADEPTGNLDSKTGGEVMKVLMEMVRAGDRTLVVVTHDAQLAEKGDRTLNLADGKLVS